MVARVHKETMNSLISRGASKKMVDDAYIVFMKEKELYDRNKLCFVSIFSKENPLKIENENEKIVAFFKLMDEVKQEDLIKKIKSRILGNKKSKHMLKNTENLINVKRKQLGSKVVFKKLKEGLKHISKINDYDDLFVNVDSIFNKLSLEEFQRELDNHNKKNNDNSVLEHVVDDLYFMKIGLETASFFQEFASPSYCTQNSYKRYYDNLMSETSFIWCIDFSREDRFKQFVILPEFYHETKDSINELKVNYILYDYNNSSYLINENYEKEDNAIVELSDEIDSYNFNEIIELFKKVLPVKDSKDYRKLFSLFKYKENIVENEYNESYSVNYIKMFNLTVEERLFGESKIIEFINDLDANDMKKVEVALADYLINKISFPSSTINYTAKDFDIFKLLSYEKQVFIMRNIRKIILEYKKTDDIEKMIEKMDKNFKENIVSFLELKRFLPISISSTEDIVLKIIFDAITEKDIKNLKESNIFFYLINESLKKTDFSEKTMSKILNMLSKEQILSLDFLTKNRLINMFMIKKEHSFSEAKFDLKEHSFQALKEELITKSKEEEEVLEKSDLLMKWKKSLEPKEKLSQKKSIIHELIEKGEELKERADEFEEENLNIHFNCENEDEDNPFQLSLFEESDLIELNQDKKS